MCVKMIQRSDPRSTYQQFWNKPYHRSNLCWPFVITFLSYFTDYRLFGAAPSLNKRRTTCNREFFTNRTQLCSEVAGSPILYLEDRGFECRTKRAANLTGCCWGNRREGYNWGDIGVKLGWISSRWDVGIWTGLGWPRIETGGGRLWVR